MNKKENEIAKDPNKKVRRITVTYAVGHFLIAWIIRLIFLVRTKGKKNEPPRAENFIVCANHIGAIDPIIIGAVLRRHQPFYMSKAELFKVPVLKHILRAVGAFPINREGTNIGPVIHSINTLKQGRCLGLFPQGTRCPGKDPRDTRIRNGVGMISSKSQADILPVYIKVKGNKHGFLKPVTVIIGEPIRFSEFNYDPEDPDEYARISSIIFDRICTLGENDAR